MCHLNPGNPFFHISSTRKWRPRLTTMYASPPRWMCCLGKLPASQQCWKCASVGPGWQHCQALKDFPDLARVMHPASLFLGLHGWLQLFQLQSWSSVQWRNQEEPVKLIEVLFTYSVRITDVVGTYWWELFSPMVAKAPSYGACLLNH